MALKLLQPGLRPVGQFDLLDTVTPSGGECGVVQARTNSFDGTDAYASDVAASGPSVEVALATVSAAMTGAIGLIDEGSAGEGNYGTLFGTVIGGTAGQGTGKGDLSTTGVVTVGPASYLASGKATLFMSPGLYGVSGAAAANIDDPIAIGNTLGATSGIWTDAANTGTVHAAICLGGVDDSSLVSTTFTAASGTAGDAEYYAIYFTGLNHTA